jgi:uncharacterized protein YjbI with pentapeptide repeats
MSDADVAQVLEARFRPLNESEAALVRKGFSPRPLELSQHDPATPPDEWPENVRIRANLLRALLFAAARVSPDEPNFEASGVAVLGDLDLSGLVFAGRLALTGSSLDGVVVKRASFGGLDLSSSCLHGRMTDHADSALAGDNLTVRSGLFLEGTRCARAGIRLLDAEVAGPVALGGAKINAPADPAAIFADRARIRGGVFLTDDLEIAGTVRLLGANVDGQLACQQAKISCDDIAIWADQARFGQGVFFRTPTEIKGQLSFDGADIGGVVDCGGIDLGATTPSALDLTNVQVAGDVLLDPRRLSGGARLRGAEIRGALRLGGGWAGGDLLDLGRCRVGSLDDAAMDWSRVEPGLAGFEYDELLPPPTRGDEIAARLAWIARNVNTAGDVHARSFAPQPYSQLELVIRNHGLAEYARTIAYERERRRTRDVPASLAVRVRGRIFELLLGYGYRPFRTVWLLVAIVLACTALYSATPAFIPLESASKPVHRHGRALRFGDALAYSLGTLPALSTAMSKRWTVQPDHAVVEATVIAETVIAWLLIPLFAAAATGLVRARA